ncbi:MAG TPA: S8 family serine peptidase, partial [Anaerolineales bacterium]|nr:S8 family serine peptidase [Anaerolineales bacterium]
MKRKFAVLILIALIAMLVPASAGASGVPAWLRPGPGSVVNAALIGDEADVYVVVFQAPALATYQGEVPGLAATNPEALGEVMLDPASEASQAYLAYMAEYQDARLAAIEAALGRSLEVSFRYRAALNGVSVTLTGDEAALVAALPGVAHVERRSFLEPLTERGPAWIEADQVWDGSATGGLPGTQGEGIVVGIIDTGVNTDHPSFADIGPVDGHDHENPRVVHYGLCAPQNPLLCNDKLIGLYDFTGTGPEDDVLHGSHVASTVAGNVVDATFLAPTTSYSGLISGVAPHANIISYKVCSSLAYPQLGACPIDALIAGIDQATIDIVDVINFSIGGPGTEPWTDPLAQAFFGARAAGIFVATSAGNLGPGPGTVGRPANAPWITSVAASTHDRYLANALVGMSGGGSPAPADIAGKGFTAGYGPAPIVHAGDYGDALCLAPFAAGTWANGEIVVCDRGINGRAEKAANAAAGGAGGYVLANDEPSGNGLVSDSYVIPGVHVTYADGLVLKAWLASGSGHTASIAGVTADISSEHGDVMASFSSRGPNAAPDLLKPDVTAPGVDILAAFHTPDPANPGPD